jgi:hypothetical protein
MLRKIGRWAVISSFGLLLFGSLATLPSVARNGHRLDTRGISTLPPQIARGHSVHSAHVRLGPRAADYQPGIDARQAIQLALDQLGTATHPTSAQAFLGTDDQGIAVWIVTFDNVCGAPNLGPPDNALPECTDNTLSVILDASTGEFIGAYG